MDISKLGSFLGGAGSILGSIGSAVGGIFQASANRRFQAKQAELQRQFNASEAQKARDYNTQMVNAQNFYNSPSEQVKRLVAAGLHPALAYGGNGAIQNIGVGSTSAQASSSASPSGASSDMSGFSSLGPSLGATLQSLSQSDVNATIRSLNENQLKYYDEFARAGIANLNADLAYKFSLKGKTDAEIAEVCALTEQSKAAASLLGEQALNAQKEGEILEYEAVVKKFEARFAEDTYQDKVDAFAAEAKISRMEALTYMSRYAADLAYTQALTSLSNEQRIVAEHDWKKTNQEIRAGVPWKVARYYDAQSDHIQWDMDTWFARRTASTVLDIFGDWGSPQPYSETNSSSWHAKGQGQSHSSTRSGTRFSFRSARRM